MTDELAIHLSRTSSGIASSSEQTKESYLTTAKKLLGPDFELPIVADGGVVSQKYGSLTDSEIEELMGCFVGVALCERKVENEEEVGAFNIVSWWEGLCWADWALLVRFVSRRCFG